MSGRALEVDARTRYHHHGLSYAGEQNWVNGRGSLAKRCTTQCKGSLVADEADGLRFVVQCDVGRWTSARFDMTKVPGLRFAVRFLP
jgi:hypothetical protein